ncbi:MFS transporter [Candidatus Woesearchaeota archaeon]|nr:MFS transporter [Candidatus Woesearchaeota archaeon]
MLHPFWWRFFPDSRLRQIYFSTALRSFAVSLIGLFIPLYLHHELGYSLSQTLYFYLFYSLIFAIATPLAAAFAARFGIKHTILGSTPFYILFVGLLFLLATVRIPLMLIAFVAGVSMASYWIGMHLLFYQCSNCTQRGEEVGKRDAVQVLAALAAPFIGGTLIVLIGFPIVFLLVTLLLLGSGLILLLTKENHIRYRFSLRTLWSQHEWRNSLFFISRGTRIMADGVIWPLFLFSIVGSYFTLGVVGSLLSGLSAILLLVVGKYSDRHDKTALVRRVTWLESLSWIGRALVASVTEIFAISAMAAVAHGLQESPLAALEYDKARRQDAVAYFVQKEIFICLGRMLMLIFVLMANSLSGGLLFQAAMSLGALLF